VLIGRMHGLHPKDDFEAARHEGIMAYVEELRHHVGPTLRMAGEEKQKAREALAATYLPQWGATVEKNLGDGPFFGGSQLCVVDLKLHMAVRWFIGGVVDHVPPTIFNGFPKLIRLYEAVRDDSRIKGWYAKS